MFKKAFLFIVAFVFLPGVTFAETMPVPTTQESFTYPPLVSSETSIHPSQAKPVGVGVVASGGDTLSLSVNTEQFSAPVDIYFAIYAPTIDTANIYLLKSDYTLQPLLQGLVPWKSNTTSSINETLYGNIPASALPDGTYYLYLAVTPSGSYYLNSYYLWSTYFTVEKNRIIRLPKTGQTKCYNTSGTEISCARTGQDGESQTGIAWPDPRFTVSGDCVTDNLTGLMWAKDANLAGRKNWQAALDYVASINSGAGLCGYHDWRLPNVNELESLINAEQADTATWLNVNGQGFINVQPFYYWSSTTWAFNTVNAWYVAMWYGYVDHHYNKSGSFYVWPVRAGQSGGDVSLPETGQNKCYTSSGTEISCARTGQDGESQTGIAWPDPRFTVSGDCVTDNLTGLMWAKNANLPNGRRTWQESLDYVAYINNSSGLCGYHDWRLPNRKELCSLIDYSKNYPALPAGYLSAFTNVQPPGYYWSSTTYAFNTVNAWFVGMWYGGLYYEGKSTNGYVWPVRAGQ